MKNVIVAVVCLVIGFILTFSPRFVSPKYPFPFGQTENAEAEELLCSDCGNEITEAVCMACAPELWLGFNMDEYDTILLNDHFQILEIKTYKEKGAPDNCTVVDSLKIKIDGAVYSYNDSEKLNPWNGVGKVGGRDEQVRLCTIPGGVISSAGCSVYTAAHDENTLFAHLVQYSGWIIEDGSGLALDLWLKKDIEYFPSFDILNVIDIYEFDAAGNEVRSKLNIDNRVLAKDIISLFEKEGSVDVDSIENNDAEYYIWLSDDGIVHADNPDIYFTDNLGVRLRVVPYDGKYYMESIRPGYYNEVPAELAERLIV